MVAGAVLAAMLFLLAAPASGSAQATVADAGAPVVRTTVERPPEGTLRRGALSVPAWAVWVGAAVVVVGAALGLGYRLGRSKR